MDVIGFGWLTDGITYLSSCRLCASLSFLPLESRIVKFARYLAPYLPPVTARPFYMQRT